MSTLDFLISKRMQRLLAALLLHPERSYSVSDLVRLAGPGRGATQAALKGLFDAGLIADARSGNQRLIKANTSAPIYPELRSLCVKTFGVQERLAEALKPFGRTIEEAFIFGSLAQGKPKVDDIDLFVVGDVDRLALNARLEPLERELGRRIDVNLYAPGDLARYVRDDRVLKLILKGPRLPIRLDGEQTNPYPSASPKRQSQGSRPRRNRHPPLSRKSRPLRG